MAAHNYDGDMLTDEVAQVHRSPGFITSNLIGKVRAHRSESKLDAIASRRCLSALGCPFTVCLSLAPLGVFAV